MPANLDAEIQRNYAVFVDLLEDLLPANLGRYALLCDQKLAGLFDSPGEAARCGFETFGDNVDTIQPVTDQPVDMGFMSNAIRDGASPK